MKSNDSLNAAKPVRIPLVVLGSPTATGKTRLAVELARACGGEIVSADSMQVYRFMDIGTAKPTAEERKRVRHHLIDVADPDEEFNAALYADAARAQIARLRQEGKTVFVVGGTGLYIRALLRGIIATPPVDEAIRRHYQNLRDRFGRAHVYRLLCEKDPAAAARLNPNDSVRVIRALEVFEQSGQSIVVLQDRHAFADCPYEALKIGLRIERDELKQRIFDRTARMVEAGLVAEVRGLLDRGYSEKLKSMQSLGYKQIIAFVQGRCALDEALAQMNRETWRYAKRQMTWFAADREIVWYSPRQIDDIRREVGNFRSRFR
jgi:tRNA dimethylallyltransferase